MNRNTENTAKQLANLLGIFAIFGYFKVHACVHITTYLQITVRLADISFFQEHVCLCV